MPRKVLPTDPERRQQINVPATPELRDKVIKAASKSGRSISREIEVRLDNSFARDEVIGLLLGGTANGRLLERIATIIRDAGHWRENDRSVERVVEDIAEAIRKDAQSHSATDERMSSPD